MIRFVELIAKKNGWQSQPRNKGMFWFKHHSYTAGGVPISNYGTNEPRTTGEPSTCYDMVDEKGKTTVKRAYYDEDGLIAKEIHNTDHGSPKRHKVPHVHDVEWIKDGKHSKVKLRGRRDLTYIEREENKDL